MTQKMRVTLILVICSSFMFFTFMNFTHVDEPAVKPLAGSTPGTVSPR